MSGDAGSHSKWWHRPPPGPRWVYVAVPVVLVAVIFAGLFTVPVSHTQSKGYLVVIALPTNVSVESCTSTLFYQAGTFSFYWYVPNGNPTTLAVSSPTGTLVYNGTSWGVQSGAFSVSHPTEGAYNFCLSIRALVPPTPTSVVTVEGSVAYTTRAPTL